jgi:hypothetical protein
MAVRRIWPSRVAHATPRRGGLRSRGRAHRRRAASAPARRCHGRCPRPILLIAAGDVADEVSADTYIRTASPATVELWVVPGARHTHGLEAEPAAWEQRVIAFLDRSLLRG